MKQRTVDSILFVILHLLLYGICTIGYILLIEHSAFYSFPPDPSDLVRVPISQVYLYGFLIFFILESIIWINKEIMGLGPLSKKSKKRGAPGPDDPEIGWVISTDEQEEEYNGLMEVIDDLNTGAIKPKVFEDLIRRVGKMHGRTNAHRRMVDIMDKEIKELKGDKKELRALIDLIDNHSKLKLLKEKQKHIDLAKRLEEATEEKEKFAKLSIHMHGKMKSMETGLTKARGDLDEEKLITCVLEKKVEDLESGNGKCIIIFPGDGVLRGSMHESFGIKEIEQGIEFLKDSIRLEQLSEGKEGK